MTTPFNEDRDNKGPESGPLSDNFVAKGKKNTTGCGPFVWFVDKKRNIEQHQLFLFADAEYRIYE